MTRPSRILFSSSNSWNLYFSHCLSFNCNPKSLLFDSNSFMFCLSVSSSCSLERSFICSSAFSLLVFSLSKYLSLFNYSISYLIGSSWECKDFKVYSKCNSASFLLIPEANSNFYSFILSNSFASPALIFLNSNVYICCFLLWLARLSFSAFVSFLFWEESFSSVEFNSFIFLFRLSIYLWKFDFSVSNVSLYFRLWAFWTLSSTILAFSY